MKVIKRNGSEVVFDSQKIAIAVGKANMSVDDASKRLSSGQIERITNKCRKICTIYK